MITECNASYLASLQSATSSKHQTTSNRCTQTMLTFKCLTQSLPACCSDVFAEVLGSGDLSRCLAELEEVPISSLWPRSSTLRVLASLLTAEDVQVNKAAANYLSSGASHCHFKARVRVCLCMCDNSIFNILDGCSKSCECLRVRLQAVEYYTQALSEAGGQSQRAACSALSCLQVSGLDTHRHTLRFPFEHVVCTCMCQNKEFPLLFITPTLTGFMTRALLSQKHSCVPNR